MSIVDTSISKYSCVGYVECELDWWKHEEVWHWQIVIPRYIIQPMDVKIAYILMYVVST